MNSGVGQQNRKAKVQRGAGGEETGKKNTPEQGDCWGFLGGGGKSKKWPARG